MNVKEKGIPDKIKEVCNLKIREWNIGKMIKKKEKKKYINKVFGENERKYESICRLEHKNFNRNIDRIRKIY